MRPVDALSYAKPDPDPLLAQLFLLPALLLVVGLARLLIR
jgi:hypothetical protein